MELAAAVIICAWLGDHLAGIKRALERANELKEIELAAKGLNVIK